ncbi:sulfotransferase domain-containing protein [Akkermansiaceae bacterium]|nr:sulfotransferase domain-containing protein [Akkermansiaceae bacterium]MDA7875335.1 sulfotransferase domain-containing protein [Akkermansiaceae bacterium]MDC0301377.1 sulfotransferase domain-containing protein [Akkermansiaceae bacterium]
MDKKLLNPAWVLKKAYLYGRSYCSMGPDDVVLALFPKTGSTWIRFFLYNLLTITERGNKLVTIDEMNAEMPEFANPNLFRSWTFNSCPRVIKTHRPRNVFLKGRPTVLVVRDPRDVVVSFYHYANAKKELSFRGSVKEALHHPEMGLGYFFNQYNSWRNQADLVLRYEDLRNDGLVTFRKLVDYLKIPATDEHIELALERSNLSAMRQAQEKSVEFKKKFSDGFVFARSGASEQWKELFDEDDIAYWEQLRSENQFNLYQ